MKRSPITYVLRTMAALIFAGMTFATLLSLTSNQNPRWFDWLAAAPTLYILISLAVFKKDSALIAELDSILARIEKGFGKRT